MRLFAGIIAFVVAFVPATLMAQGLDVAFGGLKHDSSLPVEVTADELQVDQGAGTAVFAGNVVVGQGDMRLSANRVEVVYASAEGNSTGQISSLVASGNVILVNGSEAAEAQKAVYSIDKSNIVLSGAVILTQGENALSGERLVVDLNTGTGSMEGRVTTIFQTGNGK